MGRVVAVIAISLATTAGHSTPVSQPAEPRRLTCALRQFDSGRGTLAYRDCGRGAPVIIVPGGPGLDADYMARLADEVVHDGKRAILLEPRGTGASRTAIGDGSELTVAGSVADVEALRIAIGAERVTLIGHSFGGAVVQAYAAAHHDRVARLVLVDSVGPTMRAPPGSLDSWRSRADAATLATYDDLRRKGDRIGAMRIKFIASFYDVGRGRAFIGGLPDSSIHTDVGRLAEDYAKNYDVTGAPPATFPVIIVTGDIDWIRGYEQALAKTYPKARTIIVRHAGHFSWIDSPASGRAALRSALAG